MSAVPALGLQFLLGSGHCPHFGNQWSTMVTCRLLLPWVDDGGDFITNRGRRRGKIGAANSRTITTVTLRG
jgi:hypothetical protein